MMRPVLLTQLGGVTTRTYNYQCPEFGCGHEEQVEV